MIKQLATAAVAAAIGFASPAMATPSYPQEGSLQAHATLFDTIQRHGVSISINPAECAGSDFDGYYSSGIQLLVICQDNGYADGQPVTWTANDLDTLRHEAQHFIQDCMNGTQDDGLLSAVYKDPLDFAQSVLSESKIQFIIGAYRERGASDHVLILELEAFSVADLNVPLEQSQDIANYCG